MTDRQESRPADNSVEDGRVILVDAADRDIGSEEKIRAHREGLRHRAFSVFVFDGGGRLLLQQRSMLKYHSGGLWSNTCCSHPRPGESVPAAAHRRLREEMGFDCPLRSAFSFVYKAAFDNGLIEHEYDHVLVGRFDGDPAPDAREVLAWRAASIDSIRREMAARPESYAVWFRLAVERAATEHPSPWGPRPGE